MLYEPNDIAIDVEASAAAQAAWDAPLPPAVGLTRRLVAELRAYLDEQGLGDYRVFHCSFFDLEDIDRHLDALGAGRGWEPHASDGAAAGRLTRLTRGERRAREWPSGVLRVPRFEAVVARWEWVNAINNRPGRFDVVIEIPCPARPLRVEFFRRKCPGLDEPTIDRLAAQTDRMSFAHLQEILRLAGLFALHASRRARTGDDLLRAAGILQDTQSDAARGFATRPEAPFGLAGWKQR